MLTGEREPEAVRLTTDDEIAELDIDFRRGVRAADSCPTDCVVTEDGERLEADTIVIATGSRANIPPFIADMPDVRPLRNLADARRIKEDFGRISSVLILGGGFIGAEVAGSARKLGIEATIVEAMPTILGPLGPEIAAAVEQIHREQGVTVVTGAPVEIVDATPDDGATVVLADGTKADRRHRRGRIWRPPQHRGRGRPGHAAGHRVRRIRPRGGPSGAVRRRRCGRVVGSADRVSTSVESIGRRPATEPPSSH